MKCGNEKCDTDISDGKFMTCGRCDKKYCFENPDYNNKCGGYTKKSWASIGKQKKAK